MAWGGSGGRRRCARLCGGPGTAAVAAGRCPPPPPRRAAVSCTRPAPPPPADPADGRADGRTDGRQAEEKGAGACCRRTRGLGACRLAARLVEEARHLGGGDEDDFVGRVQRVLDGPLHQRRGQGTRVQRNHDQAAVVRPHAVRRLRHGQRGQSGQRPRSAKSAGARRAAGRGRGAAAPRENDPLPRGTGLPPRLGEMLLRAQVVVRLHCTAAALISERGRRATAARQPPRACMCFIATCLRMTITPQRAAPVATARLTDPSIAAASSGRPRQPSSSRLGRARGTLPLTARSAADWSAICPSSSRKSSSAVATPAGLADGLRASAAVEGGWGMVVRWWGGLKAAAAVALARGSSSARAAAGEARPRCSRARRRGWRRWECCTGWRRQRWRG